MQSYSFHDTHLNLCILPRILNGDLLLLLLQQLLMVLLLMRLLLLHVMRQLRLQIRLLRPRGSWRRHKGMHRHLFGGSSCHRCGGHADVVGSATARLDG